MQLIRTSDFDNQIKVLCELGDQNIKSKSGLTPLHLAVA